MRRSEEGRDNRWTIVTGAGGFIGRRLCAELTSRRNRVLAQILPGETPPPCDRLVEIDIRSMDQVERLCASEVDVIYHLAARADVPGSVADPRADFEANVIGTFNVFEMARRLRPRSVLFASTVSVLDPQNDLPLNERAVVGPSSPYAAAKLACEAYALAFHRCYGLPIRVVRLFNVYGIGIRRLVVFDLLQKLLRDNKRLEILGDGSQIRDFLYIDDAVEGLQIAANQGQAGEVYHLGSGEAVTIRELIDVMIQQMGLPDVEVTSDAPTWIGDMPKWSADVSKMKALGFAPTVDLRNGIRRIIDWLNNSEDE